MEHEDELVRIPVRINGKNSNPKAEARGRRPSKYLLMITTCGVLAILVAGIFLLPASTSPVPAKVRSAVNFHIYYPNQKQLPSGFTLDQESFKLAQPGVVLFSVKQSGGGKLIFSEEAQPDPSIIDKFNTAYIPLHTTLTVALGQAEIGTYGNGPNLRTIASLPAHKGPWIIITAPSHTDSNDLRTILESMVASN